MAKNFLADFEILVAAEATCQSSFTDRQPTVTSDAGTKSAGVAAQCVPIISHISEDQKSSVLSVLRQSTVPFFLFKTLN